MHVESLHMPMSPQQRRPSYRRTFFKEWREYRELTQEQAAEMLGMDRSNLSRLERGLIPYGQSVLEAGATAYKCDPWDLLNRNPYQSEEDSELENILRGATSEERAEIIGYARGLLQGRRHR